MLKITNLNQRFFFSFFKSSDLDQTTLLRCEEIKVRTNYKNIIIKLIFEKNSEIITCFTESNNFDKSDCRSCTPGSSTIYTNKHKFALKKTLKCMYLKK